MKTLPKSIVLRPRFQIELDFMNENLLLAFERAKTPLFLTKRMDDHVFIKFKPEDIHFWSPQLHLEIANDELFSNKCKIYGLFGPNPSL